MTSFDKLHPHRIAQAKRMGPVWFALFVCNFWILDFTAASLGKQSRGI